MNASAETVHFPFSGISKYCKEKNSVFGLDELREKGTSFSFKASSDILV